MYKRQTYDSSCFCKTAFFARSALGAQTTDADNNSSSAESMLQQTSWLQCYTRCWIVHSCFYRTLGSVIEDRAGTCELLVLLLSALVCCVCDRCNQPSSAALLLCCLAALLDTGSRSKAAVPLSQVAERATVRTQVVLLSLFAL